MGRDLNFFFSGNLGHDAGKGSDGCLIGALTATDPTKGLLKTVSQAVLAYADDGGAYTLEDTAANNATANDMTLLPATPAVDDAYYFGHATKQFGQLDLVIGTAGVGTWTIEWQYWNGSAWTALAGVTDGTSHFMATAGLVAVPFTVPTDWVRCTVDSVLGYWIRANVMTYSAKTTQPKGTQAWVLAVAGSETWTDDTTDLTDAGANDIALLPAHVAIGDAFHIGYTSPFCKVELTYSTAKAGGTGTYAWQYWTGAAWATLTTKDESTLLTVAAGTKLISFVPPSGWLACTAANGPNGQAGYFIRFACTALTVQPTTIPLGDQGWVFPVDVGDGIVMGDAGTIDQANMTAQTASGTANDTLLIVVNLTQAAWALITWTGGDWVEVDATLDLAVAKGDKIAIVQVGEDGTTEFANANIVLHAA